MRHKCSKEFRILNKNQLNRGNNSNEANEGPWKSKMCLQRFDKETDKGELEMEITFLIWREGNNLRVKSVNQSDVKAPDQMTRRRVTRCSSAHCMTVSNYFPPRAAPLNKPLCVHLSLLRSVQLIGSRQPRLGFGSRL